MGNDLYKGTKKVSALKAIWRNTIDFPRSLTLSAFISGFLVVLVAATGPIVIMLQAASAGNFTQAQTATWICSSWAMSGLFGLYLSLRYRMPMIGSTSTAAIVLLVTSLKSHSIQEAVASYILVAVLFIIVGATKLMPRIMKAIPHQLVMAMLAGVLFNFGVNVFTNFTSEPWIVSSMVLAYFAARILKLRAPVVMVLAVGTALSIILKKVHFHAPHFGVTHLVWVNPHFTVGSLINLAFPMFLLTLATQFAPGFAVLKNGGYKAPHSQSLIASGVISLASAGYLNSGVNTSAITAGIAVGEHADPDRTTRYTSGVVTGVLYIAAGIIGSSILVLFSSLPSAVLAALAGLALFPALANAMHESLSVHHGREAALVTLLVTISGIHPLQLGSPFWGLVAGVVLYALPNLRSRSA
jgi:benzoate membrane transport protein